MKKIIFAITWSLLIFSKSSFAQTPANSLSIGYGVLTAQDIASFVSDILVDPFSGGTAEVTNIRSSGTIFLEYNHFIKEHLRLVVNANYSTVKSDFVYTADKSPYGNGTDQYSGLMVGLNYHWLQHPSFELYSGAQVGGCYVHTKQTYIDHSDASDNSFAFAFQATPIGFRVGKAFGVFGELGFGFKGTLCAGIDYRF